MNLCVAGCISRQPPPDHAFTQVLWTWMDVDGFKPEFALRLDARSLTMLGVITGVFSLIGYWFAMAWAPRPFAEIEAERAAAELAEPVA